MDDCCNWMDDHNIIAKKFISGYMQRFKSMHNTTRILPNLGLRKLILDLDNNELIKLPNLEEVKCHTPIPWMCNIRQDLMVGSLSLGGVD